MTLPPNYDNRILTALFAANLARVTDGEEPSDWKSRGTVMDTKLCPSVRGNPALLRETWTHIPEDVRRGLKSSFKALKDDKIDTFYLHGPDWKVPFEDTLRTTTLIGTGNLNQFVVAKYWNSESPEPKK
jgi:aflatoxin B1 aldehyde reductase